jgi:hypothetical protein
MVSSGVVTVDLEDIRTHGDAGALHAAAHELNPGGDQERPGAFQSKSSTMTPFGSRTWKARSSATVADRRFE